MNSTAEEQWVCTASGLQRVRRWMRADSEVRRLDLFAERRQGQWLHSDTRSGEGQTGREDSGGNEAGSA